jgi:hypothetical protein
MGLRVGTDRVGRAIRRTRWPSFGVDRVTATGTADGRLTELFVALSRVVYHMDEGDGLTGMETVTVELDEEVLDAVDDIAFTDHRENRNAAIRTLLDEWLKERDD